MSAANNNGGRHGPSASGAASDDDGQPIFMRCHRWRSHLGAHSRSLKALEEERARGWRSPALDAWYASRQEPQQQIEERKRADARRATSAVHAGGNTDKDSNSTATATAMTSFAGANASQLAERYREHCRRILPACAPALFAERVARGATAIVNGPCDSSGAGEEGAGNVLDFLDMGCAPGGVSKYLVMDLGWRGCGVTLPTEMGGIAVDAELLTGEGKGEGGAFTLWEGDVTQAASHWRRPVGSGSESADDAARRQEQWPGARRFRFVNGGAVQDHGQRLQQQQQQKRDGGVGSGNGALHGNKDNGEEEDSGAAASDAILPWFTLFVPQLRAALACVAQGGSVMIVYGAPQCASLMLLLRAMEFLLAPPAQDGGGTVIEAVKSKGPGDSSGNSGTGRVAVLETMHLIKPPVYVLVQGLYPKGREAGIARLFAALDPTSDILSPLPPSCRGGGGGGGGGGSETASSAPTKEQQEGDGCDVPLAGMTPAERLRAKQLFWLGESDAGFALAREGFDRHGRRGVESVWDKATQFLLSRRLRAERAVSGGRGGFGGKRPRQ